MNLKSEKKIKTFVITLFLNVKSNMKQKCVVNYKSELCL